MQVQVLSISAIVAVVVVMVFLIFLYLVSILFATASVVGDTIIPQVPWFVKGFCKKKLKKFFRSVFSPTGNFFYFCSGG